MEMEFMIVNVAHCFVDFRGSVGEAAAIWANRSGPMAVFQRDGDKWVHVTFETVAREVK